VVPVASSDKRSTLRDLLRAEGVTNAIIFCNRKTTVRELNKSLKKHGYRSAEIHGDMDQASRIAELDRFKAGDVNILVASDVAARGLDIKGVSHVFNFDAPWHPDDYVHRIGRTGRAGATGTAYTLVSSADAEAIENIEKLQGTKIERIGELPAGEEPAEAKKGRGRKPAKGKSEDKPRDEKPREKAEPGADAPKEARREERRPEPREPRRDDRPRRDRDRNRRRDELDDGPDANDDGGWNGPIPDFLNFTIPA
jgi:superfamily II DNA/RNA helicase